MAQLHYSLELPPTWSKQTESYKQLIYEINEIIDKKEVEYKSQVVIDLFELVYGTLEYLEFDASEIAKTHKTISSPRMKSYENQLLSIMITMEDICQIYAELALDRYVLYLEIFNKLLYVDLDAISLFINFISKITSKINIKRINDSYLRDYSIFCTEIAILSYESKNYNGSLEIFQELTKLYFELTPESALDFQLIPFLGLAICYEVIGNYTESSNFYFELLNRLRFLIEMKHVDELPLQLIHEVMFYGYVSSFLSNKTERLNDFYSFSDLGDSAVIQLLNGIHTMAVFGFPIFEAFKHLNLESIIKSINYYIGSSYVQSNRTNNPMGLKHLDPKLFLTNIEIMVRNNGVQKAILIVQTQHLKDVQVTIGKSNLPSLNVLPDLENNYVTVDGVKFNITSQFAFGTSFSNDIELTINYQKKQILKRRLSIADQFPPFYLIDLDKELNDLTASKEGSIKQFDVLWNKEMSLLDVIKTIAVIDVAKLTFSNENEIKNFFKDLINLMKKLNLKEAEKILIDLSRQDSTNMIMGKALKLVIIQRLSEIEPDSAEIVSVVQKITSQ